jgi:hypothetical protein
LALNQPVALGAKPHDDRDVEVVVVAEYSAALGETPHDDRCAGAAAQRSAALGPSLYGAETAEARYRTLDHPHDLESFVLQVREVGST